MPARKKTRPEGLIARLGIDLAHLREAVEDLERCEYIAGRHSRAALTQIRGARRAARHAIEALEIAEESLTSGTEPLSEGIRKAEKIR